jgi:hypothetical protein
LRFLEEELEGVVEEGEEEEGPGLFLSSFIVGNLLPYFEIFLRFNGLIVLPNQSSCCENEIELSV